MGENCRGTGEQEGTTAETTSGEKDAGQRMCRV